METSLSAARDGMRGIAKAGTGLKYHDKPKMVFVADAGGILLWSEIATIARTENKLDTIRGCLH